MQIQEKNVVLHELNRLSETEMRPRHAKRRRGIVDFKVIKKVIDSVAALRSDLFLSWISGFAQIPENRCRREEL